MNNLLSGPIESFLNNFNAGSITDIAIVFIFLSIGFVCCLRGFTKQVLGIAVTVGSILLAYFFSDDLLAIIDKNFDLTQKFANKLYGAFSDKLALQLEPTIENVGQAILSMGLPEFVANFAVEALKSATGEYETIGIFLAEIISHYILISASFLVIWLVSKIVLSIVKAIVSKFVKALPIVRGLDRLLGLVLGLIKALVLVYVLIFLIDVLPKTIGFIDTARQGLDQSVLGTLLRNNNLFAIVITKLLPNFTF